MRAEPPPFEVHTARTDGRARVFVQGEIDLSTAPALDRELQREIATGKDVVLDLSQTGFMDSTGLSTILSAIRAAESTGATFTVGSTMQSQVRRVMELAGLIGVLPVSVD
jgi:anti-sigma B factor antagonist